MFDSRRRINICDPIIALEKFQFICCLEVSVYEFSSVSNDLIVLVPIDRLSTLFPARLEEGHRGGNRLCLVESLGVACVSITLLSVADSPKMWL